MNDPAVIFEVKGPIGLITFNRPDNRNAMTTELLDAFAQATLAARQEPSLRVVVISGRGSCFSAGADLKADLQREQQLRPLQPHERSYAMYEPFLSVLDIEVPVIAALNGHAVGGGFGLALLCDLRIANRESRYGANFAKIGLHSGLGISYLLPRLIGATLASEMLFSGRLLTGSEAADCRLVNAATDADEVFVQALKLAEDVASAAPIAVRMMKRTLYRGLGWDIRRAAYEEAYAQAITVDTEDMREGVSALLEKRPPLFKGR